MRKRLGECLIQTGFITEEDLQRALAEHRRTGDHLGAVFVRLNLATEQQVAKALAFQLGLPYVALDDGAPDPEAVVLIPEEVSLKGVCIATRLEKNLLTVAMANPLLFSLVQDLESRTGYRITQVVATPSDIINAIQTFYPHEATGARHAPRPGEEEPPAVNDNGETAHIVDIADSVIRSAVRSSASDIHVEPGEKTVSIRHRLDGQLRHVMELPKGVQEGLIARIKVMAGMDIAEKRLPQDGRIRAAAEDGTHVDFRVTTLGTLFGEKIVMRAIGRRKHAPSLDEIGLSPSALDEVRRLLENQRGMMLVVGPARSGKTTTLGAGVTAARSEKANIMTIEDPIEYQIPGVNQTQVDEKLELTFPRVLRSILLQDPDVVVVGEIRDAETAAIAVQAAGTDHLVLSTLQADDAPSALTRLMDFGVEPGAIASALVGVIAQRLVRRLCPTCRRRYTPAPETVRALGLSDVDAAAITFYTSAGCDQCNHTGYRGRIGLFEVVRASGKLRRAIASRVSEDEIREAAIAGGMISLGDDGLSKVKGGTTTVEELLRVV